MTKKSRSIEEALAGLGEMPKGIARPQWLRVDIDALVKLAEANKDLAESAIATDIYYDDVTDYCLEIIDSDETLEEKYSKLERWLHQFRKVTMSRKRFRMVEIEDETQESC